jgi:uncharacterized protein with HEPN domain
MPHDDLYLVEIIEACRHIGVFLADIKPEAWVQSELVRSAVLQKLIVLGQAAGGITSDCRERHPDIPWATVKAFRNVAVHEYFAVEWPRVYAIALGDVPVLEEQLIRVLRAEHPTVAARLDSGEPL